DGRIQFQFVEAAPRRVRARGEVLAYRAARRRDFPLTGVGYAGDPEQELAQLPVGDRPRRIELADRTPLRLDPGQGRVRPLPALQVAGVPLGCRPPRR